MATVLALFTSFYAILDLNMQVSGADGILANGSGFLR
jgi:hypothetical protein